MTAIPDGRIVRCPKCGTRIWKSSLEQNGCSTCLLLDNRDAPMRTGR